MKVEFTVPDMTCGHCVETVTKAVHSVDQHAVVDITLASHRVKVETARSADVIQAAVSDAGYTVQAG